MDKYQGTYHGDKPERGGKHKVKYEVCNFSPDDEGILYGYVQPAHGSHRINTDRLGADEDDQSIKKVTVVWTATRREGGRVIVGWYNNATVFRDYQKFKKVPRAQKQDKIDGYRIRGTEKNSKLLLINERTFKLPPTKTKGFMGQSPVWYADSSESKSFIKKVRKYIKEEGGWPAHRSEPKSRGMQDQERKVEIEKRAIKNCREYYEDRGYKVKSVEKDNLGWDLEATLERETLKIEVKGLSGSNFSVVLTPNEYKAFNKEEPNYRLVVVVDALGKQKRFICRYSSNQKGWLVEGDRKLKLCITPDNSASITCDV
jgi:hypothetical protein